MEILNYVLKNLSKQKARTALTMIGIVIGIAAVVSLISLSNTLTSSVTEQLEMLGADRIIVTPKLSMGFGPPTGAAVELDADALKKIREIRTVDKAVPMIAKSLPVKYKDQSIMTFVSGIPAEDTKQFFEETMDFEVSEGRFLRDGDKSSVIVGYLFKDMFEDDVRLRSRLEILNETYRIVGVLDEIGNRQDDTSVMMTLEQMRDLIGEPDSITTIVVKVFENTEKTSFQIEEELEDLYGDDLFDALTTQELIEQVNNILGILTVILTGVAAISLLVASFSIMNTMLMAVIERTKEIGIMKAIGATNNRIISLFLVESAILGTLGGVVGCILGYILSEIITSITVSTIGFQVTSQFNILLYTGAVGFAAFVGTLSGTYPAYKAAKLDPVDALRYE